MGKPIPCVRCVQPRFLHFAANINGHSYWACDNCGAVYQYTLKPGKTEEYVRCPTLQAKRSGRTDQPL